MSICDVKNIDFELQRRLEDHVFAIAPLNASLTRTSEGVLSALRIQFDGVTYEFVNQTQLGEGQVGKVYLFQDPVHHIAFALKESEDLDEAFIASALLEKHCNVLKSRYIGDVEKEYWRASNRALEKQKYVFLQELADGDLKHLLMNKKVLMPPKSALQVVEQLRRQMVCLYELTPNRKFVYCDVKLENVFYKCESDFSNFRVFLGDLESAVPKYLENSDIYSYGVTYAPAEDTVIEATDVDTARGSMKKKALLSWSVGISLLFMTAFFVPNFDQTLFYQQQYSPLVMEDLKERNMVVEHSVIQNFLNECYGRTDLGYYLSDDPYERPDILQPLVDTVRPMQVYIDIKYFEAADVERLLDTVQDLLMQGRNIVRDLQSSKSRSEQERLFNYLQHVNSSFMDQYQALMTLAPHFEALVSVPQLNHAADEMVHIVQLATKAEAALSTNVLQTHEPTTVSLAFNLFLRHYKDVGVVQQLLEPLDHWEHVSYRMLLDLLFRIEKQRDYFWLENSLTFCLYTEPPLGGLLGIATNPTLGPPQANPYANAILLTKSWESYKKHNTMLQSQIETIQKSHNFILLSKRFNTAFPNLFTPFLVRVKYLIKTMMITHDCSYSETSPYLDMRVIDLQKQYTCYQRKLYEYLSLTQTCYMLPGIQNGYNNPQHFQNWMTCVNTHFTNNFFHDVTVLDLYVIQNLPCNGLSPSVKQVEYTDSETNTLKFVRCMTQAQKYVNTLKATKVVDTALRIQQELQEFCDKNKNVGFDYNTYLYQANQIIVHMNKQII